MTFRKMSSFSFRQTDYSVQSRTASCETQSYQPKHGFWEGSSEVFPYPFTSACQQYKVLGDLGSSFEVCIESSRSWEANGEPSPCPTPTLAKGSKIELKLFLQHQLDGSKRMWAQSTEGHGVGKNSIQSHQHLWLQSIWVSTLQQSYIMICTCSSAFRLCCWKPRSKLHLTQYRPSLY